MWTFISLCIQVCVNANMNVFRLKPLGGKYICISIFLLSILKDAHLYKWKSKHTECCGNRLLSHNIQIIRNLSFKTRCYWSNQGKRIIETRIKIEFFCSLCLNCTQTYFWYNIHIILITVLDQKFSELKLEYCSGWKIYQMLE